MSKNAPPPDPQRALTPLSALRFAAVTPEHLTEIQRALDLGTRISLDYVWLVLAACVIATFGLLVNSPAVIIGAMIISPLMLSIQSMALGLVRADYARTLRSMAILSLGGVIAVGCSTIVATLDSRLLQIGVDPSSTEILNRTRPWLPDMVVALAGGAAGAFALVRPGIGGAIAGVAISTALMPPLCVVGIGIAHQSPDISRGAFFLFLANVTGIVFASALVFLATSIGPSIGGTLRGHALRRIAIIIMVLAPVLIPLAFFMQQISQDLADERLARGVVTEAITSIDEAQLVSLSINRRSQQRVDVTLTVRSPRAITSEDVRTMQSALTASLPGTATLHVLWIPIIQVEASPGR